MVYIRSNWHRMTVPFGSRTSTFAWPALNRPLSRDWIFRYFKLAIRKKFQMKSWIQVNILKNENGHKQGSTDQSRSVPDQTRPVPKKWELQDQAGLGPRRLKKPRTKSDRAVPRPGGPWIPGHKTTCSTFTKCLLIKIQFKIFMMGTIIFRSVFKWARSLIGPFFRWSDWTASIWKLF